jgi:hypothetical protein
MAERSYLSRVRFGRAYNVVYRQIDVSQLLDNREQKRHEVVFGRQNTFL